MSQIWEFPYGEEFKLDRLRLNWLNYVITNPSEFTIV